MSNYSKADTKAQWFQDDYPGAAINPNVTVIHTTEGTGWPSYGGGASAPHYTAMPDFKNERLIWRAHFPDERSARALRNLSGGVETNTLNCVQVELIGTCDPATHKRWGSAPHIFWPAAPEWALRDLAAFLADQHKRHGTKLQAPEFLAYPASYGASRVRMTFAEWRGFYGVCGHQHVPENSHGDPGALPIGKVLAYAKETAPPKPGKKPLMIRAGHASMQYSDTRPQVVSDARAIFARGYDWLTGTEAGENPVNAVLKAEAEKQGYTFHEYKSNWVAIKKANAKGGKVTNGAVTVVDNDLVIGPGHDLNIVWSTFDHPALGRISVMASHYATKGRPDAKEPLYRRNLAANKQLAAAIGKKAGELGKGTALVFYGGDQNIVDALNDTFFGQAMTSSWDELKRYENTGHGNIDVIASYDADARVKAVAVNAYNDRELHLHSDHYLIDTTFAVVPL